MKKLIVLIALSTTVCFSSCEKNEPQIIEKIVEKQVTIPEVDQREEIIGTYSVVRYSVMSYSVNGSFTYNTVTTDPTDFTITKMSTDKNKVLISSKSQPDTWYMPVYKDKTFYSYNRYLSVDIKQMTVENMDELKLTDLKSFVIKTTIVSYDVQTSDVFTVLGFFEYRFTRK